jgi:hypothetical protein
MQNYVEIYQNNKLVYKLINQCMNNIRNELS